MAKPIRKYHSEYDPDKEDPYWEPSSKENELKMQLQMLGIEEITAESLRLLWASLDHNYYKGHLSSLSCRLYEELGSGHFGVVNRGVWSVEDKEREVAVKSLADGSSENQQIQFLQEAAIMGQFRHPNVITLHGLIMENDPVSVKKFPANAGVCWGIVCLHRCCLWWK